MKQWLDEYCRTEITNAVWMVQILRIDLKLETMSDCFRVLDLMNRIRFDIQFASDGLAG